MPTGAESTGAESTGAESTGAGALGAGPAAPAPAVTGRGRRSSATADATDSTTVSATAAPCGANRTKSGY